MKKTSLLFYSLILVIGLIASCSKNDLLTSSINNSNDNNIVADKAPVKLPTIAIIDPFAAVKIAFGNNIDPVNLLNYANQIKPNYINKDNARGNNITNPKATLGRVLFYEDAIRHFSLYR